jgi:hypothetical protein
MRQLVGYFIRRTYRTAPRIGKTLCATTQRIYPTRALAEEAAQTSGFATEFDLEVVEAFMHTEEP